MPPEVETSMKDPQVIEGTAAVLVGLLALVAGALAIAVGASQFVYTLLKPTGIFDWIQRPPDKATPDVLY